jgi:GT2 family glycosyltransferase
MGYSSSVSVVIPTFNRVEMLCCVLPSYLNSPVVQEVIIVDDASTDHTGQEIGNLATREPRLHYVRNERNLGAPASRNRGALLAHSEWVLESEDDLALGEKCVETLLEHGQKARADIIAGRRVWMRLGETQEQALERASLNRRPLFVARLLEHNSHAITQDDVETPLLDGTMLIRRKILEQVWYYEPYGGQSTWREESDFQLSALEKGCKLVFCPHAVTFHYSRASQSFGRNRLQGDVIYAYRIFRNNLIFLRRHQDYLRANIPQSLVFGSPLMTGLAYGLYRAAWLFAAEIIRMARARKYGAFSWK